MVEVSFLIPTHYSPRGRRVIKSGRLWIKFAEGDSFTLDGEEYFVESANALEVVFRVTDSEGNVRKRKMSPSQAGRLYWNAKIKSQWQKPPGTL